MAVTVYGSSCWVAAEGHGYHWLFSADKFLPNNITSGTCVAEAWAQRMAQQRLILIDHSMVGIATVSILISSCLVEHWASSTHWPVGTADPEFPLGYLFAGCCIRCDARLQCSATRPVCVLARSSTSCSMVHLISMASMSCSARYALPCPVAPFIQPVS
jgi:hypothetical protein